MSSHPPNAYAVFLHSRNKHRTRHRPSQRRGVKVGKGHQWRCGMRQPVWRRYLRGLTEHGNLPSGHLPRRIQGLFWGSRYNPLRQVGRDWRCRNNKRSFLFIHTNAALVSRHPRMLYRLYHPEGVALGSCSRTFQLVRVFGLGYLVSSGRFSVCQGR